MPTEWDFPIISLPQGQVKGVKCHSIYEQSYYSFEGIPYGKPPVGQLQFRAPVPADSWTGIKDCTNYVGKPCQKNLRTGLFEGLEDCLYLNVYTKTLQSKKPLPVMVYIFGGGFYKGEATRRLYSPDYFMNKNIVLVTINYRLCALGFLCLKDPALEVPGNAGLKDQVLALRWVNKHIGAFNGDVNNITLFGESAGAGSAHILCISEQTRGLFHKAIIMSGSALCSWANTPQTELPYRLAKYHGYCGENIDRDVLAYLSSLKASQLVDHDILTPEDKRNKLLTTFGPTTESYLSEHCILPKDNIKLLKAAWSNKIPIMFGGSSLEGLIMYPHLKTLPQQMIDAGKDPAQFVPLDVREHRTAEEAKQLGEKLLRLHVNEVAPNEESIFKFVDLYSYKIVWHGLRRSILARLAYAPADTYLYRFDFDSPDFNHFRIRLCGNDPVRGATHGDELAYLFHSYASWKLAKDSAEYKTIERMVGMWTAFAENSNPNCNEIKPLHWPPVTADNPNIAMNISNELSVIELPEKAKLDVWDSLYDEGKLY